MRKIIFAITLLCCCLLAATALRAQDATRIQGKVADVAGATIPNAAVSSHRFGHQYRQEHDNWRRRAVPFHPCVARPAIAGRTEVRL